MQIDYGALQGTASRFIASMGRDAILRDIDGGAETPCTALMTHGPRDHNGRLSSDDDRRAIIAGTVAVVPDPEKHRFVLDGKVFRIVTVRAVKPATTALYYDCAVRA